MSGLHVSIEQFEGPLALLLYLIRKEEMDIYDIPIHRITQKYLEHIKMMKKLDLEGAGDFITMAATLIHIKSKMLLPQYDDDSEEMPEDPRKELVQRLVEYQRYQNASKEMLNRSILNRDVWRRGFKEDIVLEQNQDVELDESGLFGLIAAYRSTVRAAMKRVHRVAKKGQSIASRILEIRDLLIPGERKVMKDLIAQEEMTKNKLLVTFLSMLELAKMGFVRIFQAEPYADIHVEPLRVIDRDVIQRAESYESEDADGAASAILSKGEEILKAEAERVAQVVEQPATDESEQLALSSEETIARIDELVREDESATDEEIMSAEKELGIESPEGGFDGEVVTSMEPVEDIINESLKGEEQVELSENEEKIRDAEL